MGLIKKGSFIPRLPQLSILFSRPSLQLSTALAACLTRSSTEYTKLLIKPQVLNCLCLLKNIVSLPLSQALNKRIADNTHNAYLNCTSAYVSPTVTSTPAQSEQEAPMQRQRRVSVDRRLRRQQRAPRCRLPLQGCSQIAQRQ